MKLQASTSKLQGIFKLQAPNFRSAKTNIEACSFVARGLALFLGGFCLLNLMGHFWFARFDANLWWIDIHWISQSAVNVFLLASSFCLIAFSIQIPRSGWRRSLTLGCAAALIIAALADTAQFYVLLLSGAVHSGVPIPLSLFISAALAIILAAVVKKTVTGRAVPALAVCLGCVALFPLAQMFCFGKTDYRRPADAIVVLGARAYADGRPSQALADRVRTACRLYHDGLARTLIFSGGPGDGAGAADSAAGSGDDSGFSRQHSVIFLQSD
jgi:hypothetical protein